nr:immunoglobulin heavy chain junction region [Macaca mulatta]
CARYLGGSWNMDYW